MNQMARQEAIRLILRQQHKQGCTMLFAFAAVVLRKRRHILNCYQKDGWHSVATLAAFVAVLITLPNLAAEGADSVDLRPITKVGSVRQARVIVEVEGKL